jgi:hypothetical protein
MPLPRGIGIMASTSSRSLVVPALLLAAACSSSSGSAVDGDAGAHAGDASIPIDAAAPTSSPTTGSPPDGAPPDAVTHSSDVAAPDALSSEPSLDGSLDSGYALCGAVIDPSLKTCATDGDCTFQTHLTDCCGGILYVGIARSSGATFAQCEQAWEAHFPACGCFSTTKKTEDGRCLVGNCPASDASPPAGAMPLVHCVATGASRSCETYLP